MMARAARSRSWSATPGPDRRTTRGLCLLHETVEPAERVVRVPGPAAPATQTVRVMSEQ